jgi:hypothetical protein
MNVLADNVFQMTNAELIGLAKNRFLDYETQDKIALNPYKRAHMYLIDNIPRHLVEQAWLCKQV